MINKKRIAIIFALIIVAVSIIYILSYSQKTQNAPTTSQPISLKEITPGITTEQQVLQNLGIPIASNDGILQYKSNSPARNNEISIQNGKVNFVKEIVSYKDTTITLTELNKQYGNANYLYGPDSVNGYFLYYHPEKGIAYLANPNTGTVLEIWHFPATTFDNFLKTWAKDYSTTPLKNQF